MVLLNLFQVVNIPKFSLNPKYNNLNQLRKLLKLPNKFKLNLKNNPRKKKKLDGPKKLKIKMISLKIFNNILLMKTNKILKMLFKMMIMHKILKR
jgi:hypothetical protein